MTCSVIFNENTGISVWLLKVKAEDDNIHLDVYMFFYFLSILSLDSLTPGSSSKVRVFYGRRNWKLLLTEGPVSCQGKLAPVCDKV